MTLGSERSYYFQLLKLETEAQPLSDMLLRVARKEPKWEDSSASGCNQTLFQLHHRYDLSGLTVLKCHNFYNL